MSEAVDTQQVSTTPAQEPELWRGLEPTSYTIACFACREADRVELAVRQTKQADRFYILCSAHGLQEVARDDLQVKMPAATRPNAFGEPWLDLEQTQFRGQCWACRGELLDVRQTKGVFLRAKFYVDCPTHGIQEVYRRFLRRQQ